MAARLLLAAVLAAGVVCGDEQTARAAGGRGPELRSRVTAALDELERAVAAEPANGELWWSLGVHAQVAAGGSVPEELAAVALLERALELAPGLAVPYENAMAIGDMHRGTRNATRARHFYAAASDANPLAPVQYMYAGLTYELEGNFALAGRAYVLASRVQAHHMRAVCEHMADAARFAAACWPSGRGSSTSYVAYLAAAVLKAGDPRGARRAYSQVLGFPARQSFAGDCATQLIANAATGRLLALHGADPHPLGTAERHSPAADAAEARADAALVREAVRRHQFPGTCAGRRKLLYAYSQAFGFGAHAHMLSLALNLALYTDRVLVPVDEESWWSVCALARLPLSLPFSSPLSSLSPPPPPHSPLSVSPPCSPMLFPLEPLNSQILLTPQR